MSVDQQQDQMRPHLTAVTPTRNGAEVLLRALVEQGVEVIFGYPGGAVLPIYDALFQQTAIRHILVRHEQAAVHAAEGYARSTGRVGCVLVTSGPGATNAVTGLLDALMDSVPLVCLTGQVPTHLIGNDAFQEADTTGITRPATKHNYLVKRPEDLARVVHEAFYVARTGRPGPVVIDLPKDVVIAPAQYTPAPTEGHRSYRPVTAPDPAAIARAVALLKGAKRPVVYAGGGVINAGAAAELTEFVRLTGAPCTHTLMGLGAFAASDPRFLGMLGMHGTYEANLAMHDCDVMLNVGARFDDRVTGRIDAFSPGSTKIHCDIDPSSINKNIAVDLAIIGDAKLTLRALIDGWRADTAVPDAAALAAWWGRIDGWRAKNCLRFRQDFGPGAVIKPQYAIRRLHEMVKATGRDTFITTEVGQHQMWAAQHYPFEAPNRWMTSGGLGTMGYGLPAAIGAQIAHPDALVIDIAGEASILMNIQEMSTVAQYRLPVKVFILNNEYMGMVRQWQELLHGGRYSHSYSEALPDFVRLAEAFHATGLRAERVDQLDDVIRAMLATDGPVIADIRVDPAENCYPMIPSGAPHNEMLLGRNTTTDRRFCPTRAWRWSERPALVDMPDMVGNSAQRSATISVVVENEAGVLARVIGLFSGRGYNIDSLTVAAVDAERHLSRINVVTSGTEMVIEQIKAQLDRLVPVHKVADLTREGPHLARELALIKVAGSGDKRLEALRLADAFRARVIDATSESFVFELTGNPDKMDAFLELMQPLGLIEVSRTGVAAIARGLRVIG